MDDVTLYKTTFVAVWLCLWTLVVSAIVIYRLLRQVGRLERGAPVGPALWWADVIALRRAAADSKQRLELEDLALRISGSLAPWAPMMDAGVYSPWRPLPQDMDPDGYTTARPSKN